MAIRGVHKIVVGVRDQERAKRFWSEVVGFEITTDVPYDDNGNRWVEVTSADGVYADDIEKTYEELSAKGVEFPAKP